MCVCVCMHVCGYNHAIKCSTMSFPLGMGRCGVCRKYVYCMYVPLAQYMRIGCPKVVCIIVKYRSVEMFLPLCAKLL